MLTTTHPYTDGRIFQKEARSLAKKHAVTIIAPGDIPDRFDEAGIKIIAVKKSKSLLFHPLTILRIFLVARKVDTDVFHCHEPDSLLIGLVLKLLLRKPVVYDVHEHWPSEIPFDFHIQEGSKRQKVLGSIVNIIECLLAKQSDGIIAVSESVAERFEKRGVRPIIISNFSIPEYNISCHSDNEGNVVVSVAGNMHLFHGILEGILAVERIITRHTDVSLKLIGNIRFDLEDCVPDMSGNWGWIEKTGYLPYDRMYEELGKGSIGLLLFQPHYYNISIGLPNKLFDYMLMGLPVVASDLPEIRRVVEDADCGILVNPADVEVIAEAIDYLLSNPAEARRMGENGRKAVIEKYNWGNMEKVLLEFYETLEK